MARNYLNPFTKNTINGFGTWRPGSAAKYRVFKKKFRREWDSKEKLYILGFDKLFFNQQLN